MTNIADVDPIVARPQYIINSPTSSKEPRHRVSIYYYINTILSPRVATNPDEVGGSSSKRDIHADYPCQHMADDRQIGQP